MVSSLIYPPSDFKYSDDLQPKSTGHAKTLNTYKKQQTKNIPSISWHV
tara:strand:+ start:442 stop:585 length:144 start_codon:yes stop_codon:yes gene_type:complete